MGFPRFLIALSIAQNSSDDGLVVFLEVICCIKPVIRHGDDNAESEIRKFENCCTKWWWPCSPGPLNPGLGKILRPPRCPHSQRETTPLELCWKAISAVTGTSTSLLAFVQDQCPRHPCEHLSFTGAVSSWRASRSNRWGSAAGEKEERNRHERFGVFCVRWWFLLLLFP